VKIATHFESTRLSDPTHLQRSKPASFDQPLDFLAGLLDLEHLPHCVPNVTAVTHCCWT
jgi:hypothetical protein